LKYQPEEKISDCGAIAKSRVQKIAEARRVGTPRWSSEPRRGELIKLSSTFSINGQLAEVVRKPFQEDKKGFLSAGWRIGMTRGRRNLYGVCCGSFFD